MLQLLISSGSSTHDSCWQCSEPSILSTCTNENEHRGCIHARQDTTPLESAATWARRRNCQCCLSWPRSTYRERLRRDDGARLVRVRWYGTRREGAPGAAQKMFVERKTHRERWSAQLSIKASLHIRPILMAWPTTLTQLCSQVEGYNLSQQRQSRQTISCSMYESSGCVIMARCHSHASHLVCHAFVLLLPGGRI